MQKYVAIALLVLIGLAAVTAERAASHERSRAHSKSKHHRSKHRDEPVNPAAAATTTEQAEDACAQAAAAGTLPGEQAGAGPEAQADGDVNTPAAPAQEGGPMIVLPDGSKLPLPSGCGPFFEAQNKDSTNSIPPGVGPCQACEADKKEPLKEIQVLEWPKGKTQPIVIGKQLLTANKTKLMLKVLTGEFDKIEADWKKKEADFIQRQNEIKQKQEDAAAEYAARVKEAAETNADDKIEAALSRALDVWGLESSYKRGDLDGTDAPEGAMSPEEIAAAKAEEVIDTVSVAKAGPGADGDQIDQIEAEEEAKAEQTE